MITAVDMRTDSRERPLPGYLPGYIFWRVKRMVGSDW